MLHKMKNWFTVASMVFSGIGIVGQIGNAASYKILVVMAYHEEVAFVQEYKEGIESVLGGNSEIKYVYLDAIRHPEGIDAKAKDAFAEYQAFQPDGVIATDDETQAAFVVPYLKEKVKTPVMFCGVRAAPEKYGYPAANVSGILARPFFREGLLFAQQVVPSMKTIIFIYPELPVCHEVANLVDQEKADFPLQVAGHVYVQPSEDLTAKVEQIKNQCDALFIAPIFSKEEVAKITQTFGKPTLVDFAQALKAGALSAVVATGQEHGRTAAEMLVKALEGTPVASLPITANQYGKRMLNITVMKALGIKPTSRLLTGVELVKTDE